MIQKCVFWLFYHSFDILLTFIYFSTNLTYSSNCGVKKDEKFLRIAETNNSIIQIFMT